MTDRQASHSNGFDYLRLFAALLVIFGHAHALTGQAGPGFAANGVQTIGLKIFFVLSGYLVSKSWLSDPHALRFMQRRCLRIFPALATCVVLTAFVAGPLLSTMTLREYFVHTSTWQYLYNIALNIRYGLPLVFSTNVYAHAVNGSLWSLPVEFVMYLVGPALILVAGLAGRRVTGFGYAMATILVSAASLFILRVQGMPAPIVIYGTNIWFILELAPYFLIGGAYAVLRWEAGLNLGIALAGVLALAMFPLSLALQELVLYAVLPYACLALGLSATPLLGLSSRFGDLSYGLFLYSFPVQQTLVRLIGTSGGAWLNFALGAVFAAALAFCSWRLVEQPALRLKPTRRLPVADDAGAVLSGRSRTLGGNGLVHGFTKE